MYIYIYIYIYICTVLPDEAYKDVFIAGCVVLVGCCPSSGTALKSWAAICL